MKADIIACYPKSLIGRIISYITKCEISHVAIMIDDENIIESDWLGVKQSKLKDIIGPENNLRWLREYEQPW